jgi:hypothetical protein
MQKFRVRFPALSHFLRTSVSGTGSAQPCEDKWGATWKKKHRLRSRKLRLMAVGNAALMWQPSIRKSWYYYLPTSVGSSVGIFRLRNKGQSVCCVCAFNSPWLRSWDSKTVSLIWGQRTDRYKVLSLGGNDAVQSAQIKLAVRRSI